MPPSLIFGAGGIGTTANSFTFTWDTPEKVSELLDKLKALDILELDSAAAYPPTNPWNTETLLGQAHAADKGFVISSKVFVRRDGNPSLSAEAVAASLDKTLSLLGTKRVHILHAHVNDGITPLEEQAAAFDKQFRQGKFERFGISNYSTADVKKLFAICDEKGYVKPSSYQGMYNALSRDSEDELLPLLREHNCSFSAYSPLAGGFLTGKVTFAADTGDSSVLNRTRWEQGSALAYYGKIYDNPAMHNAIRSLKKVCDAASPPITLQEASMRWIIHHSALKDGDGVIFGAKTLQQIESNVTEARRGPLPDAVREVIDSLASFGDKGNL